MDDMELEQADTLEVAAEPKSSARLLEAIEQDEKAMSGYHVTCQKVDDLYSLQQTDIFADDTDFQLFWASMEILKPAIYARPPVPVVAPRFKDRDPVVSLASEMVERALVSTFADGDIDEVMLETRDDLALNNRGVQWLTYENDDGQKVCIEHLDRTDFGHEPARKWADVGRVWRRAWMTRREMADRFDGDHYMQANFTIRSEEVSAGSADNSEKAGVYEVWSKPDNRVYWVTPGCAEILDEGEPHLDLRGFFPCPRPAYGTRRRRSLVPVPDYLRYSNTLGQISELTRRIYDLLQEVRLKGFFPAGGDIGAAVETALADQNSASILIPVPAAAFMGSSGGNLVQFLPLAEISTAIQGLIAARGQLIQDFYEISGISDIMRGATDAGETLGAQQLKQHNGSIRVQDKIDELTRLAADTAHIAGEIIAEHFSPETILKMSQMKVRKKSEIKAELDKLEKAADQELRALGEKAKGAMEQAQQQGMQPEPEQMQQMEQEFQQAQQAIIAKYSPQIESLGAEVPIEDVMKLLRDGKTRGFVIEIQTDSTVLTDDMAEKASRAEFLNAFNAAGQSVMMLAQAGKSGAELGGGLIQFALAPFRVGREMDGMIDKFVEDAENMAQQADGGESDAGLAEAQKALADAEMVKAQAAMEGVKAKAAQNQAENERKIGELQAKVAKEQQEGQLKSGQLELSMGKQQQDFAAKIAETEAKVNKMQAETAAILQSIGLDVRKQDLEEYRAAEATQAKQVDQAMAAQGQQRAAQDSDRNAMMQERQQENAERTGERQQTFAEQQAMGRDDDDDGEDSERE